MKLSVNFAAVECCSCHIQFAMTMEMKDELRNNHKWFYCPKGHQQHYSGESEAEKLKNQLRRKDEAYQDKLMCCLDLTEEVQHMGHRITAYKGHLTRAKSAQVG